ncbi:MAG: hypothetical protein KatS3mg033_0321 [Thermonema sp.]|uniref:hypothetical protein n=1 Tax=Thermonema sp. TaxID=2231181 RepID=UPI0021DCDCC6|nr:hypothetical protein [Thermonema sp.]GIV38521.1 MAG: hypothetical protein KatS3mg033_0321 [Thermonema sp.]
MEELYSPTLMPVKESSLSEEEFQAYHAAGRYEELAALIIEDTLEMLNAGPVNPYLRQQAIEACAEVLRQHRHTSFESFMRGVRSAIGVILLSDHTDLPNRMQVAV